MNIDQELLYGPGAEEIAQLQLKYPRLCWNYRPRVFIVI